MRLRQTWTPQLRDDLAELVRRASTNSLLGDWDDFDEAIGELVRREVEAFLGMASSDPPEDLRDTFKTLLDEVESSDLGISGDLRLYAAAWAERIFAKRWRGLTAIGTCKIMMAGHTKAMLVVRPQLTPLLPRAIVVPPDVAPDFRLLDAKVGTNSLFITPDGIDAFLFTDVREPNLPPRPITPVVYPYMDMVVHVENRSSYPREFSCVWLCEMLNLVEAGGYEGYVGGRFESFSDKPLVADEELRAMVSPPPRPFDPVPELARQLSDMAAVKCAGGCGRASRPNKQLCAFCAGPAEEG